MAREFSALALQIQRGKIFSKTDGREKLAGRPLCASTIAGGVCAH
jgi:hypothetical protein